MPWVVIIGATGFYLNHARSIDPLFQEEAFSEDGFEAERPSAPITIESARSMGESIWPEQPIERIWEKDYHGRPSFFIKKGAGLIILSIPTGHHYLKSGYTRRTFAPDGALLHSKTYWGRILGDLHEDGWLGGGMGSWFADIVALAMLVFGLTGPLLWAVPRVKRLRRALRR